VASCWYRGPLHLLTPLLLLTPCVPRTSHLPFIHKAHCCRHPAYTCLCVSRGIPDPCVLTAPLTPSPQVSLSMDACAELRIDPCAPAVHGPRPYGTHRMGDVETQRGALMVHVLPAPALPAPVPAVPRALTVCAVEGAGVEPMLLGPLELQPVAREVSQGTSVRARCLAHRTPSAPLRASDQHLHSPSPAGCASGRITLARTSSRPGDVHMCSGGRAVRGRGEREGKRGEEGEPATSTNLEH
jgi:hypothetical protein